MQNTLGMTLASLLGLDPRMGLLAGSITLSGGHGTGAAWSATFAEKYGLHSAAELAIACATFGLSWGGYRWPRGAQISETSGRSW